MKQALSPYAEKYLAECRKNSTVFWTDKGDESDQAWERAQYFLVHYSALRIQVATTNILETYNPIRSAPFGYRISRFTGKEGIRLTVECYTSNDSYLQEATDNSHIAAYYIRFNKAIPTGLISY
ncbi:MAG TPA: hypothetical protein VFO76_10685 [Candidatus Kapabacteria bacterium]|nr:hypothetical protein [Candidatus Kapabacteria bacterium]